MAHNSFNHNWTEEHTAILCQVAPYTGERRHRHYPCQWVMSNGGVCNTPVQCCEFPEHLRSSHGVAGPDKAQVTCYWSGCFSPMRKESLMRHVNEKHLEVKYACEVCALQFTRSHTLRGHVLREHS